MMPWNPIHRYAGVQSSIAPITTEQAVDTATFGALPRELYGELMNGVSSNPFGNGIGCEVDVSFGHATSIGSAAGTESSRRPLGFVDVRSDAGDDASEGADDAATPVFDLPGSDASQADVSQADASQEVLGEIQLDNVSDAGADEADGSDDAGDPNSEDHNSEDKVPFYKRELSFGRKKAAEPVVAETPEPEAEPVESPAEPIVALADEPEQAKAEPEIADEQEAAGGDAEEKVPFFKRELGFRKRRDDGAAEEAVSDEVAVDEVAAEPEPEQVTEHIEEPIVAEELVTAESAVDEPVADDEKGCRPVDDDELTSRLIGELAKRVGRRRIADRICRSPQCDHWDGPTCIGHPDVTCEPRAGATPPEH